VNNVATLLNCLKANQLHANLDVLYSIVGQIN